VPLETWATFALAAEILLLIPGPTILLVVAYALAHGRTATVPLVVGVGLGDLTAMVFSFIGLGVLLQTLATLFVFLKWAGAAYLVYLGIQLWRTQPKPLEFSEIATTSQTQGSMLWHTWVTTALNPKGIVFFIAFVPQFLDREAEFLPQVLLLGSVDSTRKCNSPCPVCLPALLDSAVCTTAPKSGTTLISALRKD
jgi:threonine/homoserine/homoserine lactone efflux protein